jgi:hypothetical protein
VASWNDAPPGGFPQVFDSLGAIERTFPGQEVVIFERPVKPPNIITRSKDVQKEAAQYMQAPKKNNPPPIVSELAAAFETVNPSTVVQSDAKIKALEFLKRITFAKQYASEENEAILGIQADIIEELIEEVFES